MITSYAYQYDAAGNRTQVTEKDGAVTTYNYDETGQLTRITSYNVCYTKLLRDRLATITDGFTENPAYATFNGHPCVLSSLFALS